MMMPIDLPIFRQISLFEVALTDFDEPRKLSTFYSLHGTDYEPEFLRADSQRGAAEFTIARRKRGRVV